MSSLGGLFHCLNHFTAMTTLVNSLQLAIIRNPNWFRNTWFVVYHHHDRTDFRICVDSSSHPGRESKEMTEQNKPSIAAPRATCFTFVVAILVDVIFGSSIATDGNLDSTCMHRLLYSHSQTLDAIICQLRRIRLRMAMLPTRTLKCRLVFVCPPLRLIILQSEIMR